MADRIESFDVVIPAAVPKSAPIEIATAWPQGDLEGIEVVVPDGPNGFVGFQLAMGHGQMIPRTLGSFIVSNDENISWPIQMSNNNGAWSVIAYNTGVIAHTIEVRFLVNELAGPAPIPPQPQIIVPEPVPV